MQLFQKPFENIRKWSFSQLNKIQSKFNDFKNVSKTIKNPFFKISQNLQEIWKKLKTFLKISKMEPLQNVSEFNQNPSFPKAFPKFNVTFP